MNTYSIIIIIMTCEAINPLIIPTFLQLCLGVIIRMIFIFYRINWIDEHRQTLPVLQLRAHHRQSDRRTQHHLLRPARKRSDSWVSLL